MKFHFSCDFAPSIARTMVQVANLEPAIVAFYNHLIEGTEVEGLSKLIIQIFAGSEESLPQPTACPDKILLLPVSLDITAYLASDPARRNQLFLDMIHSALVSEIGNREGKTSVFEAAYERIRASDFVFEDYLGAAVRSPNHKLSARVRWELKRKATVFVEVTGTEEERILPTHRVSELPPSLHALRATIGKIHWNDAENLSLWCKNGQDRWDINISTGAIEFHFARAESGDPHGLYDLGVMYLEGNIVLQDNRKAVHYFELAATKGFGRAKAKLNVMQGT